MAIRTPTLKVEKATNGQWYVKARGANGEPVFWTETYTRKADAVRAKGTVLLLIDELIHGAGPCGKSARSSR